MGLRLLLGILLTKQWCSGSNMAASQPWFVSDHHLGHANILKFKNKEDNLIRPGFDNIGHMNDYIIEQHNKVVKPGDRVYFLGDFSIHRYGIQLAKKMLGRKILIKGNHDIFALKDYAPYFDDLLSSRAFPFHGLLFSHIPLHPRELGRRWKMNVHGHTHSYTLDDPRYLNVCVEQTKYAPVSLEEILSTMKDREL